MGKRTRAMVVYDGTAAAASQQRGAKRPRSSADAGAVVTYDAAAQHAGIDPTSREEPSCLRRHILPALGLRADLPVHFIDDKPVTNSDIKGSQSRFRIPTDGVLRHLRPILTPEELDAASLLGDPDPRPRQQKPKPEPRPENDTVDDEAEDDQGKKTGEKKKMGRVHDGLAVKLVDLAAGASGELRLSRWDSSHGTVVKGKGYTDFIRGCSLEEKDNVEVWAFKQRAFRLFGRDLFAESSLHLLIVKRDDDEQQGCCYCPRPRPCALSGVNASVEL